MTSVSRPAGLALVVVFVLLFGAGAAIDAYQGMGPKRPTRHVRAIRTDLPPIAAFFRDVAVEAGLTGVYVSGGETSKKYILETTGSGVTVLDFDGDGWMDLFVGNGTTIDGDGPGAHSTPHLYRNLGGLKFEDVTVAAGLARVGWVQGACSADYDNDGDADLFVGYIGQSALYRNDGGGRFTDVALDAGLRAPAPRWDSGCTWLDYDLDGRLDLMLTSYLEFDRAKVPAPGANTDCQWKGMPVMCGPRGLPFSRNALFHNEGEGRFRDVSVASGVGAPKPCYAFTAVSSDFDSDGYPDAYVACDSNPSLLYHNRRDGTFEEVGLSSGVALSQDGQEQSGMGIAVADYDEDGFPDIVKTNFSDEVPNVFHNNGDGTFEDRVFASGLAGDMAYVGWGVHLLDVDNDGSRDLLMVNGHVYPEVDQSAKARFRQPRLLYWNVGGGKFKDISADAGPGLQETWSSRGSAAVDLDNDGGLEVVINNLGDRPSLLKNFAPRKNWLLVGLRGVRSNRDAVGARAVIFAGGRRVSGERQTGASFVSQNDPRLHFGLGSNARYEMIEVTWPGGEREVFPGGEANRIIALTQGTGTRAVAPPPPPSRPAPTVPPR